MVIIIFNFSGGVGGGGGGSSSSRRPTLQFFVSTSYQIFFCIKILGYR
jgi:hypothetical protein